MNKHTPGPWDVRKIDNAPSFRGIFGICANGSGNSIREEEEANARLIAAAPELLEALERFVKYTRVRTMELASLQEYANLTVLVGLADEAIAKAKKNA